jgi:hypothetical protein
MASLQVFDLQDKSVNLDQLNELILLTLFMCRYCRTNAWLRMLNDRDKPSGRL